VAATSRNICIARRSREKDPLDDKKENKKTLIYSQIRRRIYGRLEIGGEYMDLEMKSPQRETRS
jgi:hypothetical protein